MDIIFFALLAAFLVLRLLSVLGQRTGQEGKGERWRGAASASPPPAAAGKPAIEDRRAERQPPPTAPPEQEKLEAKIPGLRLIRQAWPSFRTASFLKGASAAFNAVLDAFARGQLDEVRTLLGSTVYQGLRESLREQLRQGQRRQFEVVSIDDCAITDASLEDNQAVIVIRFRSTQIDALYGADGALLRGDPQRLINSVDVWVFTRRLESKDPNWRLVETRTA